MSEGWVMALLPICLVPAVLFMSGAGENEGDGFFRVGVTHSLWQRTQWDTSQYSLCLHITESVAFKLNVIRDTTWQQRLKCLWVQSFLDSSVSADLLKRSGTVILPFIERDNGLFTPAQTEGFRQAATGWDISADVKHCVTTEITEPWGLMGLLRRL